MKATDREFRFTSVGRTRYVSRRSASRAPGRLAIPVMTVSAPAPGFRSVLVPAVIVGALGYFVDIYDLILFSIVRVASLKELGLSGDDLTTKGLFLINTQMYGLLFGSILMYSVANLANAFVHSVEAYAIWRFIAGIGLAGELGGSITLVSEV